MLKKLLIRAFWIFLNIFLVPIGYFNLFSVAKSIKLKKIRVFNFFDLDDGNLNFIAIQNGKKVFIKIDLFGRGHHYQVVKLDSSFPRFIVKNKKKYKNWII